MKSDFIQCERAEKTNPHHELTVLNITEGDVKHLLQGGKLYYTDCEHAYEIMMKKNKKGGLKDV